MLWWRKELGALSGEAYCGMNKKEPVIGARPLLRVM